MKRLLLLIPIFALGALASAQRAPKDFGSQFLEANRLMEEKFWNQSIEIWKELYESTPQNANVNYKLGYCYLQTANDKLKSLPHLEYASSQKIQDNYDPFDIKETLVPIDATFYLGRAYHLNYEMDKAIAQYQKVMETVSKKNRLYGMSERQIELCNNAKYQVANPQNFIISNVGEVINKETNEYSPVISIDESALFFTSRRMRADSTNQFFLDIDSQEFREDIYVSYKDINGNWMSPELLNINTDSHAATISTSPDGQELYIYYDFGGDGQIWKSELVGETWSDPVKLGSDINSEHWETHMTISTDGRELYFVSNRPGGEGNRDIYRCVKLPNDEWSKSLNVGPVVNTEYDEDSPFLSADGKTLYFASTGHDGMGGFDIFYTTRGEDGEWSKPTNIGYPVNTVDDDVFFVPAANGKRAYYSSFREEGFGLKDIYVVDMPDSPVETDLAVLKGYIYAAEGEELPDDTFIRLVNEETGEVTEYRPRQRDGAYVAVLPPCITYRIEYFANAEMVHKDFVNVPCESAYSEIEKEVYLLPVNLAGDASEQPIVAPIVLPVVPKDGDIVGETPKELDANDKVGVIANADNAYYQRYFVYDMGEWTDKKVEETFAQFTEGVSNLISIKGKAKILIESSASKVPSSRFKNNQELSSFRNKKAEDEITKALEAKGYKKGTDFSFQEGKKLVSGPDYKNDAQKNKHIYEQFQYIKVWAE